MPTYEYACTSCGEHLEVAQSFRDDALTVCPACGGPLRKVFGSIGVVFKGSGFYKTDSRPAAKSSASSKADSGGATGTADGSAAGSGSGAGSSGSDPKSAPSGKGEKKSSKGSSDKGATGSSTAAAS
jgi:putative FmdB family regulatory protein